MVNVTTIPLRNDIFLYKFRISLSDIVYTFSVRYNGRMNRWILDISDISGSPILGGIVLLVNRDFLNQYETLNVMSGKIITVDTLQKYNQPTQFSFGDNNFLVYVA